MTMTKKEKVEYLNFLNLELAKTSYANESKRNTIKNLIRCVESIKEAQ